MGSAPDQAPSAPATTASADVVALFDSLIAGTVHPPDARTTRARTDGRACPLCRAGWCVQQEVPVPGGTVLVLHGLLLH